MYTRLLALCFSCFSHILWQLTEIVEFLTSWYCTVRWILKSRPAYSITYYIVICHIYTSVFVWMKQWDITCSVVMLLFGIFGNFYWWALAAAVDLAFILWNTLQCFICYVFDPVFLHVWLVSLGKLCISNYEYCCKCCLHRVLDSLTTFVTNFGPPLPWLTVSGTSSRGDIVSCPLPLVFLSLL